MNLDILLYIVLIVPIIILILFTLYIRYKRKGTMVVVDDGVNDFEVLDKLIDELENKNK